MGDSDKPFACPSPGCNMSFANEDHLDVHQKKHDMILNLGVAGKSGSFVADQTPTPTRFIRNCEEVGLFQDLQNVNPFEETFRRAVESGKIGESLETEIIINDDTLHTPHVFPHIDDGSSSHNRIVLHINDTTEIMHNNSKDKEGKVDDITLQSSSTTNDLTTTITKKNLETIVIQEADTSLNSNNLSSPLSTGLSINGEEVQLLLKTQDGKIMQLAAIPVCDSSNSITNSERQKIKSQTITLKTDVPLEVSDRTQTSKTTSSRLAHAKMRLRQVLKKNDTKASIDDELIKKIKTNNNNNNNNNNNDDDVKNSVELMSEEKDKSSSNDKKEEILARNRLSSTRSRARKKEWIGQLQSTVKNVNEINFKLKNEISCLKLEVARLKTLLLAHKDCPVTKAMEKHNGIIVEPEVICLSPQIIHTAIPTDDISQGQGIKRKLITNENSIKKKQQLIPKIKPPIILPKSDEISLPVTTNIIGNSCAFVKIIDTGQKNLTDQPIFIVQNPVQNQIKVINPTQFVQVDQSLQLMNLASKTTGT